MKMFRLLLIMVVIGLVSFACSAANVKGSNESNLPKASIATSQQITPEPAKFSQGSEKTQLSKEEAEGLVYMREEEKLARDLYENFYEMWGLSIFHNIALSEQTHMDSVLFLLEKYEVADPSGASPTGVFSNPILQTLYDHLLSQGSLSIGDALKAGAAVEEIDILDLRERIERSANTEIKQVYQNLESGSHNHLRSFTSVLASRTGEGYIPVYLPDWDYQHIVSSGIELNGQGPGRGNRPGGPKN